MMAQLKSRVLILSRFTTRKPVFACVSLSPGGQVRALPRQQPGQVPAEESSQGECLPVPGCATLTKSLG